MSSIIYHNYGHCSSFPGEREAVHRTKLLSLVTDKSSISANFPQIHSELNAGVESHTNIFNLEILLTQPFL